MKFIYVILARPATIAMVFTASGILNPSSCAPFFWCSKLFGDFCSFRLFAWQIKGLHAKFMKLLDVLMEDLELLQLFQYTIWFVL